MDVFKIALAGAASLGLVLTGTANAAPTRSNSALLSAVTIKKIKLARTVAPAARESKEVEAADVGLGFLAAGAAGLGLYEATKNNDSSGG